MIEHPLYASDMAGHCMEIAAWKLLCDIAPELLQQGGKAIVKPSLISIQEDGGFQLEVPQGEVAIDGFDAPECEHSGRTAESAVWSLGATVFYIMMGCQVMNGKGGGRQSVQSRIPYLRHGMPDLSELTQRCLHYQPRLRPAVQDIIVIAKTNLQRCEEQMQKGPMLHQTKDAVTHRTADNKGFWPEEMRSCD